MSINPGHKEARGEERVTGWSFCSAAGNEIHEGVQIFCRHDTGHPHFIEPSNNSSEATDDLVKKLNVQLPATFSDLDFGC